MVGLPILLLGHANCARTGLNRNRGPVLLQDRDEDQVEAEPRRIQPPRRWLRPIVATAFLAPVAVSIFVDHGGVRDVILIFILTIAGPGMVLYGLTLTAAEHAERPHPSDEGYLGLWIAHHLPLHFARIWWVVFGLAWTALLGAALWRNWPTTATPGGSEGARVTRVDVVSSGSPEQLVRGFLLAAYAGDGMTACAQLTPALLDQQGGAEQCPDAVVSSARENASLYHLSPVAASEHARTGSYSQTVVADRAGVGMPEPGDPFEGSSLVHLVTANGRWRIACLGYCKGLRP